MIRQYKVYVVCGQSVWSHWSANVDAAIIYQWWLLRRKEKEIANDENRLRYTYIYIYIYIYIKKLPRQISCWFKNFDKLGVRIKKIKNTLLVGFF